MYELYIQNKATSSWSMRTWLLLKHFNIPFQEHTIYAGPTFSTNLKKIGSLKTVPVLKDQELFIGDTLAIAEYLAEKHPKLWPENQYQRAKARYLCAEMHSGFSTLRKQCPMNCTSPITLSYAPSSELTADINRITEILTSTLEQHKGNGDFLFGDYSIADAYFTPIASRFISYGLPCPDSLHTYFEKLLTTRAAQAWMSLAKEQIIP